jgi:hypothetical protein
MKEVKMADKTDLRLNKACDLENRMLKAETDDERNKLRSQACIYFRQAMKEDGNEYKEDII